MYEGEEMKDVENKMLEKYWVDVNGVRKSRGGFLCDTKQGLLKLKELSSSDKKVPYVQFICQQLIETGFENIDPIFLNKEGEYVCTLRDGGSFILKKWYAGRECDLHREQELIMACETLAVLHNHLDQVSEQLVRMDEDLAYDQRWLQFAGINLEVQWNRHNNGLKKTRQFIREKVRKTDFESLYLNCFEDVFTVAKSVEEYIKESNYKELYQQALEGKQLVHGDYNYHNILFASSQVMVMNFERFRIDIPISDLIYFLRKVMEKTNWNESLGRKMLSAYHQIRPIREQEYEYMALRLSYPEKVWKLANQYYNGNKAFLSPKNVEKLEQSIQQMGKKQQFVQHIFAFHL